MADKPRSGRPTPLTKDELISIRNLIKVRILEPKKTGISSKEVLEIIEHKINRKYTLRHTQRLLHKIGLSLTIPRVSHIRKDEKAQNKFREEFKKKLEQENMGYSIVTFDEAGFRLVPVYRRVWFFKEEMPKGVLFWSNKKLTIFGALMDSQKLFYEFYDALNSLAYKAFLSDFIDSLPKRKKFIG